MGSLLDVVDWVAVVSVQVTVLALLAALGERLLPRRLGTGVRRALWGLVFVRILLPTGLLPADLTPAAAVRGLAWSAGATGGWASAAAVAWGAGAIVVACALARRLNAVRRRVARLPPAGGRVQGIVEAAARDVGLRRAPPVVIGSDVASAHVVGPWRSVVVLPASVEAIPDAALRLICLHELVHVARRDVLRLHLLAALTLPFWFHPAVWWARRRLLVLGEVSCDARVVALLGGDARAYRQTLGALALGRSRIPGIAVAPAYAGEHGTVERMRWLRAPVDRGWRVRAVSGVVLVAGSVVLLLAAPASPPIARSGDGCLRLRARVLHALASRPAGDATVPVPSATSHLQEEIR